MAKITHEPSGADWAKPLGDRWAGECKRAQSINKSDDEVTFL